MNNQSVNCKIQINLEKLKQEVDEFLSLCSRVNKLLMDEQNFSESSENNEAKFVVASADEFCDVGRIENGV